MDLEERQSLARIEAKMFGGTTGPLCVDRYELREQLGSGGMGVVYAAWDPELRRRVAVKLVRIGDVGSAGASRLLREAQAIARISHPNVIPVHDVGTYAASDGDARSVFVVMELVVGCDLERWLAQTPRAWRDVLDVFCAAGRGIAAAHEAGILHRDFKPSNVLIGEGEPANVRVVDFGLARAIGDEGPEAASQQEDGVRTPELVTREGAVLGTPYFMAPEQLAAKQVDARSDQYAFCVALYAALFGIGPFPRTGVDELLVAKRKGERLPPPEGTDVPRWLLSHIERGLDPDPERRFASMTALLQTIDRDLRRRRDLGRVALLATAIVAAVGLGLVAGRSDERAGAMSSWSVVPSTAAREAEAPPVIAFAPFQPADGEAWTENGVPNLMVEELRDRDGLAVISYYRLASKLRDAPRDGWPALAGEQGATLLVSGTIHRTAGGFSIGAAVRRADGTVVLERTRDTDAMGLTDGARALARDLGGALLGRALEDSNAVDLPLSYERSLQLGIAALERFDLQAAQPHLDEARRLAPDAADAHFYGAILADWNGRNQELESELGLIGEGLSPAKAAFVNAMRTRVRDGYPAMLVEMRRAATRYPDDIYLAYGLFEALWHNGEGADATAQFHRLRELSPNFAAGLMHVLERAAAIRDERELAWGIAAAEQGGQKPEFMIIWSARARMVADDHRGALDLLEPLVDTDPWAADLALGLHAVVGEVELVRARIAQARARNQAPVLAELAICTATAERECRASALARARADALRAGPSDTGTLAWLAVGVHESLLATEGSASQVQDVAAVLEQIAVQRVQSDVRVENGRVLIAAAAGDAAALETARANEHTEVRELASALLSERAGDPITAAEHWRAAIPLAVDGRAGIAQRFHLARVLRAAGDHAGVRAACREVLRPASFDWSWGAAVGPCLLWSAAAEAALGDPAAARATYERLLALRARADAEDALVAAARDGLAALG
ncbi:MAG TPA: protein kinase, partial [Nannocystaceae bacterium]|nr:protein kinase [Nannocystaceae bacterium]